MKLISVLLPSELNVANCLLQTVCNRIGSFAELYKIKRRVLFAHAVCVNFSVMGHSLMLQNSLCTTHEFPYENFFLP